jgi:hypothetical protein
VGSRVNPTRVPGWYRLQEMFGLSDFRLAHTTVLLVATAIAGFVAVTFCLAFAVTRRAPTSLEWFAVGTTVLVVVAFIWPPQFHYHFSAFLAPFLALAVALPLARLIQHDAEDDADIRPAAVRRWTAPPWLGWYAAALAGLAIAGMSLVQARSEATSSRMCPTRP